MRILNNGTAVIEGDSHISKWVEQEGRLDHDQNMLPFILPYIPLGGTVIDAGAFIGDHTIAYARAVGETGEVVAIEANPKAFECLQHNMKPFPQVTLVNQAIGKSGQQGYKIVEHPNAGMAFLDTNGHEGDGPEIVCLDSLLCRLTRIDFIKIDCEGFEFDILIGGMGILTQHKPTLLLEINRSALARRGRSFIEIQQLLASLEYDIRNIYAEQPMEGEQFDIICFRKAKFVEQPKQTDHESSQEA